MSDMKRFKISPKFAAIVTISTVWMLFQLYLALFIPLHPIVQGPLHLMLALLIVFLYHPLNKKGKMNWKSVIDVLLMLTVLFLLYYFMTHSDRLAFRVPYISPVLQIDIIAMILTIIVLTEAVRRMLGNTLVIFIAVVIIYMWFGQFFPGIFRFGGTNINRFTDLMTMGSSGVFGTPLQTSVNSLFYFIVFGAFFAVCGGGQFLLDFGMKFSKNSASGPAKAAVMSSALMGTISGSAVANVSTTGVLTIPMMKKVGYTPEQAGAIEAVASTGGQIMPPIMGVGAFIMAEMLGIPYRIIAFSAIIPASAYFLSVFLLVTLLAKRREFGKSITEIKGVEVSTEPLLPRLYLLIPIVVLVYFLVDGASLMRSGMMGIYAVILINFLSRFIQGGKNYVPLKKLGETMLQGIKQASAIAIPTAACGIIIGSVIQSGLATRISTLIMTLGMTNLTFALMITMLGCIVLGMALPTVAAYLVSVVIFVPTLTGLGIAALPANMFVFYFGIMAQITPPVCLASFTAAGIAEANPWKTGWRGAQYALVAFLIPYIFIFDPGILLIGSNMDIVRGTALLFVGTYLLVAGMAGYLRIPLGMFERVILCASAIMMIVPEFITDVLGIGVGILMLMMCEIRRRRMLRRKEV